jgi:DNA primase
MPVIAENSVREVLARASITQVVGEYVTLKKAGTRFKGLCPFHHEKTPSFTVSEERGFYYCFGCGASGDSISFLREQNGLSFVEALEALAQRTGVMLEKSESESFQVNKDKRAKEREGEERMRQVTRQAGQWFQAQLKSAPRDSVIWRYLEERGIHEDTAIEFQLGFAPDGWDHLSEALVQQKIPLPQAEALGLVAPRKNGRGFYDRFRNRLMFPIFDLAERMIAFGSRILPSTDEEPGAKYINSPESAIYTKGDILFGLAQAKKHIRSEGSAILVEGNIDVLSLHQEGFKTTVAPMGTALTPAQVRLLNRFTKEIILLYDGDEAGRNAARKSLPLLLDAEIHGRVALLPMGEDPDTFVRNKGVAELEMLLSRALPLTEFMIEDLVATHGLSDHGRAQTLAALAPHVSRIRDFRERDLMVTRISSVLNLPEDRVAGMLKDPGSLRTDIAGGENGAKMPDLPLRERKLVEICLLYPACLSYVEEKEGQEFLEHEELRAVLWEAITLYGEEDGLPSAKLMARIAHSSLANWVASVLCSEPEFGPEEAGAFTEGCISLLEDHQRSNKIATIQRAVESAERQGDEALLKELMQEKLRLVREMRAKSAEKSKAVVEEGNTR